MKPNREAARSADQEDSLRRTELSDAARNGGEADAVDSRQHPLSEADEALVHEEGDGISTERSEQAEAVSSPTGNGRSQTPPGVPTPAPGHPLLRQQVNVVRGLLVALVVMVGLFVLNYAEAVLVPTVTAALVALVFRPVTRRIESLHINAGFSSALIIFILGIAIFVGIYMLADPAARWVQDAPHAMDRLEQKLHEFKQPMEGVSQAAEQLDRLADVESESGRAVQTVEVRPASMTGTVLNQTTSFLVGLTVTLGLAFFLMAMGDKLLRKIVHALPNLREKRHAVEAFRQMESNVSEYLLLRTFINVLLGVASSAIFWGVGLPNFIFWGVAAAVLNYIPYIGPVVMFLAVSAASLLAFDSWQWALVGPVGFIIANTIEAYVVTPLVFGKAYRLNPAMVFLWLVLWGWLWGITGALLAVPMLICFRIMCDHNHALKPIGEFLGDE